MILNQVAIIEALVVDFGEGLTVVTGETGAGKSLLLSGIAMAFGAKASPREVIRQGAERASVELYIALSRLPNRQAILQFLEGQGIVIAEGEPLHLYREWSGNTSRCRINGVPVTLETVIQIRPWILDVHGQHELTNLFEARAQRQYLDSFGGEGVLSLREAVGKTWQRWQALHQDVIRRRSALATLSDQVALKTFQLEEIREAALKDADEDAQCKTELSRLSHAESLIQTAGKLAFVLNEGTHEQPSILMQLSRLQKDLSKALSLDNAVQPISEQLTGATEALRDVAAELESYSERVAADPERLHLLMNRLDQLEKLKKKYGHTPEHPEPTLAGVLALGDQLESELATAEAGDDALARMEAELTALEQSLAQLAEALSAARAEAAAVLKDQLEGVLDDLRMPAVAFEVRLTPLANVGLEGRDEVVFYFSANPGEALKPLAQVASGGELSRFLLALKTLIARREGVGTLVFDEVDSGVSGPVAKAVAQKLCQLSLSTQVIAITHQPLVAVAADQHLHVQKTLLVGDPPDPPRVSVSLKDLADETERLAVLRQLIDGQEGARPGSESALETFIARLQAEAAHWKALLSVDSDGKPAQAAVTVE